MAMIMSFLLLLARAVVRVNRYLSSSSKSVCGDGNGINCPSFPSVCGKHVSRNTGTLPIRVDVIWIGNIHGNNSVDPACEGSISEASQFLRTEQMSLTMGGDGPAGFGGTLKSSSPSLGTSRA
jgi:hypothetical protein